MVNNDKSLVSYTIHNDLNGKSWMPVVPWKLHPWALPDKMKVLLCILIFSFLALFFQVTISSTAELCCQVMQIVRVHLDTTFSFPPHNTRQTMVNWGELSWEPPKQLRTTVLALQGKAGETGLAQPRHEMALNDGSICRTYQEVIKTAERLFSST